MAKTGCRYIILISIFAIASFLLLPILLSSAPELHSEPVHAQLQRTMSTHNNQSNKYSSMNLSTLAAEFKVLRELPSHYKEPSQYTPESDDFNGSKHQVMQALQARLGSGTSAQHVMETMGEPDEITRDINNPFQQPSFMPGPVVPEGMDGVTTDQPEGREEEGKFYMCFYWRGRHDFLWFKVREADEVVETNGWYYALE